MNFRSSFQKPQHKRKKMGFLTLLAISRSLLLLRLEFWLFPTRDPEQVQKRHCNKVIPFLLNAFFVDGYERKRLLCQGWKTFPYSILATMHNGLK